ncbi:hypothetical protein EDD16DRAFT_1721535 [Pisolithus croceorrhizus]|nr:hypothetical protein EDD16DRAFT_1721535 [Pisolithus croceorrhizus]KAI6158791.1 hypothetical protein EDD17DRAFT_1763239 [Pisolithus thermaeus]
MTAKNVEAGGKEKVQRELEFKIQQLKEAVSLKTKADTNVKVQFEGMSSKVDLIVHGDIKLDFFPKHPMDVLNIIPQVVKILLHQQNPGFGTEAQTHRWYRFSTDQVQTPTDSTDSTDSTDPQTPQMYCKL